MVDIDLPWGKSGWLNYLRKTFHPGDIFPTENLFLIWSNHVLRLNSEHWVVWHGVHHGPSMTRYDSLGMSKLTLPEMIVKLVIILTRIFNNRSPMDCMRWKNIFESVSKNTQVQMDQKGSFWIDNEYWSCYQYRIHNESRVRWFLSVYLIRYKGFKIQIRWLKHP